MGLGQCCCISRYPNVAAQKGTTFFCEPGRVSAILWLGLLTLGAKLGGFVPVGGYKRGRRCANVCVCVCLFVSALLGSILQRGAKWVGFGAHCFVVQSYTGKKSTEPSSI